MRSIRHPGTYFLLVALLVGLLPGAGTALASSSASPEPTVQQQGTASATAIRAINVRSGPDRNFWVIDVMAANETVPILGINSAGTWWLVDTGFAQGWVANSVVTASNAAGVPVRNPGATVAVTAGELNVRTAPGVQAPSLGLAFIGNRLFVIGRNDSGSWLNVRSQFGTGWVAAQFTSAGGTGTPTSTDTPVTADPAVAIVNAVFLNVRTGPSVNFEILGVVRGGAQLPIIGASADRSWFNVETPFGPGWVSDLFVVTQNEFGSAPTTTDTVDPATVLGATAIVNASVLNIRSGPAATFTVVDQIRGGEQFQILARNASFTWLLLDNGENDGWVNQNFVIIRGNTANLPVANASSAPSIVDPDDGQAAMVTPTDIGPIAFVATGALNIRSGPNAAFEALGFVYAATRMPIIGQSPDGNWWQVESPFGVGWVNKRFVIAENGALNVPVVQ
jgi:uncharacterized protein YraI